ncbi:MAG: family 20 glycosylhydrolase [Gammaproteobacteria bacterium]|nr:family 20 glycosylhydrolase [Gammaproteobacteria bacterium]
MSYGGFYTQEEVREIVRYAAERFITVVPEIEMPGHAQAAIAAYPALGVDAAPPSVSADWGVHTQLFNVEEFTFTFLENVLGEVLELFPGPYIHVGGDEAVKDRWEASARVQSRMRELGVSSPSELQSYFIRRIERFLASRGRRLVGWDEILEGGIAPNATVMSWRGVDGAVEAASHGHDVVMAPAPVLYLDHLQSDDVDAPPGRPALVTLEEVYRFEPVPRQMKPEHAHHVLGAQANVWTEHMRTPERVEHGVFPRLAALAELTWSPAARRDFTSFLGRLDAQLARYEALGTGYARSALQPHATAERLANRALSMKRDEQLRLCTSELPLHLEDDAPADGERAVFLVDILDPCWVYERAPLEAVTRLAVTVGQVPYNFQLWKDAAKIVQRPALTPAGELQVRLDTCTGRCWRSCRWPQPWATRCSRHSRCRCRRQRVSTICA